MPYKTEFIAARYGNELAEEIDKALNKIAGNPDQSMNRYNTCGVNIVKGDKTILAFITYWKWDDKP